MMQNQVHRILPTRLPLFYPLALALAVGLAGCSHAPVKTDGATLDGLKPIEVKGPIELKLKSKLGAVENVAYLHKSLSKSFEDSDLRSQKDESLEFVSQAETVKVEGDHFTQVLTVTDKDGDAEMHDFAMPDIGEKLDVTADARGRILRAGTYPANSIFYVPPVSLPEGPVNVGETWTMQASWLTLDEMVPFQLDMVSILKGVFTCGNDQCAEIEIQGDVSLQGPLVQSMTFKSNWRGHMYFAIGAGTVVWSRIDSVEEMNADRARRDVHACLEAQLMSPKELRIANQPKPTCSEQPLNRDPGTVVAP